MDRWNQVAAERLMDLVRLPTVAAEAPFAGVARGWNLDRAGTFAQAEAYLTNWLMTFADQVATQDVDIDGRTLRNVWAHVAGDDPDRAVLLEGHYDVVALDGVFSPTVSPGGKRVLGRGTTDMKGGLVAALLALEDIVRAGRRPRVDTYVLLTCEEEVAARAIQVFLSQKPDRCDKVDFAVCLEPTFQDDEFQICPRHPGVACLEVSVPVPQTGEGETWLDLCLETGEDTPHASREPIYLDPNFVLLKVLQRLPRGRVAVIESDRLMDKEANAISGFARAIVSAEVDEATLHEICEQEVQAAIDGIRDEARRERARSKYTLTITRCDGTRRALFDTHKFADSLLSLRQQATAGRYTNALYGRTPFTFAILAVQDGQACAKIDLRPDIRLGQELERLVSQEAPASATICIKWNDPGLELPGIEANETFQRFLDCCRRVFPRTVIRPIAGWTEAAPMTKELGVPVVIAGPGQLSVAHKKDECVALDEMRAVYTILQAFLS